MLVDAAGSVGRMKGANYLSAQHARLTARRGMGRAAVAVAHLMLVWAYYILLRDEPYAELGADWLARRDDEAHTPGWSPNSNASATPWSSTRSRSSTAEALEGRATPAPR